MRVLLLTLLLPALALAQYKTSCQDTIALTTADTLLPYSDTCYSCGTLTWSNSGINTNNKDRILITGGTLAFANGGGDNRRGIFVNSSDYVYLNGITIYAGNLALDDDADSNNVCLKIASSHHLWADGCTFVTDGLDGRCVDLVVDASSYAHDFDDCEFQSISTKFSRRDDYLGANVRLNYYKELDSSYHVTIRNCNVVNAIHTAIAIAGYQSPDSGALCYIYNNTAHMNARNDRYTTYTGSSTQSLGNPFFVTLDGVLHGSQFYDNYVASGTTANCYGGDGFLVQGAHGWATDPIEFYRNRMHLHHGAHVATDPETQASLGYYIRKYSGGDHSFNENVHIYDDTILISVDTATATKHTGRYAEGIRVGVDSSSHDIIIANEYVDVTAATAGTYYTSALTFHQDPGLDADITIANNYFGSYKTPIWLGGERIGIPANDAFIRANRIASHADLDSTVYFHPSSTYRSHSIGNVFQDNIYEEYADPNDIIFSTGSLGDIDSLGKSVEQWQTVELLCLGADGNPIPLVAVWAQDQYDEQFLGYSNFQGYINKAVKIKYDHNDYITTDGYNPGDSTFSPFYFRAYTFGGLDTTYDTLAVAWNAYRDTLVFSNTNTVAPPGGKYTLFLKRKSSDAAILVPPPEE